MGLLSTIGAASARAYGFTRSAVAAVKDTYFNLTTLLLNTSSTNGAQNNTFIDSSSNNFTITRNGNTTQGTFTPFSQTGWSNYFNGSTDFLSVASNAAFGFGTGDFTYEFFLYLTASPGSGAKYTLIDFRPSNTGTPHTAFVTNSSGTLYLGFYNGTSDVTSSSQPLTTNTWYHCAYSRASGTLRIYVNGQQAYSAANTIDYQASRPLIIGTSIVPSEYTPGYISNLRVTKGGALYTTTFTPPTSPLTTTVSAGTVSLLTCQSNRFIDNSSNAFAITTGGTPSVQAFSPFAPTAAYSTTTVGGSGYFDGNDSLVCSASGVTTALAFGTGDFTLSCWCYPLSFTGQNILDLRAANGPSFGTFYISSAGKLGVYDGSSFETSNTLTLNSWNYVVASRVSGTLRMFINGTQGYSAASSGNWNGGKITVGAHVDLNGAWFYGYMAGLRIVKGSGVTSSTVPTSPETAITNTTFLLNYTNAGIYDATAKNVLETVGNAQVSTTQAKFGTTSIYFDGTGDNLYFTNSKVVNFGSSDFTIEFWIYRAAASASSPMYSTSGGSKADVLAFDMSAGGSLIVYATASGGSVWSILNGSGIGTLSTSTWYHVALVRNGSTWKGYLNGTAGFTVTNSSALASIDGFNIGTNGAGGGYLNGYMDEIRISRYARYTADFTPPTTAFPVQ